MATNKNVNVKQVKGDFKQLQNHIEHIAECVPAQVISKRESGLMSFDETEEIPNTLTGSITVSTTADKATLYAESEQLLISAAHEMKDAFTKLTKEEGL